MTAAVQLRLLSSLAAVVLLAAACAPAAGPLGTPAPPVASAAASDHPAPSDVAPSSPAASEPASEAAPSAAPTDPGAATPGPSSSPADGSTASPATQIVRAYFLLGSFAGNEGLVPVLREIPATRGVAVAAVRELLRGPQGAELEASPGMFTAIPDGTRLLGVEIADGTATVDLGSAFASGGGSLSMTGRLAQVVYTLTQFPTVDRVRFSLDGVPVSTFGGEGIILDGPVTRADFRDLLPAIFVDRPAWGAAAGNPVRLSGLANVFEASFVVQVLDGRGRLLVEQPVQATCGTGCWGTFGTDVAYELGRAQYGTLRVFEWSARDGEPVNVTEYRVWLTP